VLAGTQFGGYASQVVVPADDVVALPEELSFEQGAAIPDRRAAKRGQGGAHAVIRSRGC